VCGLHANLGRRVSSFLLALPPLIASMTIRANKFTPEVLLSAPRRSEGIPNSTGFKVLYSTSTYSFEDHAKTSEIRVLDVKSGETSLISDSAGASEPQWLDDETVLLLSEGKEGTSVKVRPVKGFDNRYVFTVTGQDSEYSMLPQGRQYTGQLCSEFCPSVVL
jgi:hypothetical protein